MAWTAPRTWVTSEVVTASNLNTHVRDNFNETGPAKATSGTGFIVATGTSTLAERKLENDAIDTSESTSSGSYVDLATVGPTVAALTTGTKALIIVSCRVTSSTLGTRPSMGFDVSGASTISASELFAYQATIAVAGNFHSGSYVASRLLTAGSNTFTAKYASLGAVASATFAYRRVQVVPAN